MAISPEQQQYRDAFGQAVTMWFKQNQWSQQVPNDWASATNSDGPWNSQMSLLMRGRHDPKANFWVALCRYNAAIGNKALEVKEKRLRERIEQGFPFLTAEGQPATATDFFGMFVGEVEIPDSYAAQASLTDAQVKKHCDELRALFKKTAKQEMQSPAEAWEAVEAAAKELGMKKAQQEKLRDVLSGWAEYSAEELAELAPAGLPSSLPMQAISK